MATIKSVYKRYNGSSFDIIYFKTSYDQVGVDATTRFLKPSTHTVNGKSFYNSGDVGITLNGEDILVGGAGNENDYASYTLEAAIRELKAGVDAAQTLDADLTAIAALTGAGYLKRASNNTWSLDTTVLTSGNYSTTLGSVYQGKNNNLTSLAGLSASSTGLVKFTNGTASIDTTSYATTSAIANMVTTGGNLTSGYIIVGNSDKTIQASDYSVSDLVRTAEGASKSFVTTDFSTISSETKWKDEETAATTDAETSLWEVSPSATITLRGASSAVTFASLNLKVGDILYFSNFNLPDWWVSSVGSSNIVFHKLETTKVQIEDYVLKTVGVTGVSYNTSSHKIQKTINGTTTDVVDLDDFASLNDSTGAISIGGVSKTPLYSHQTMYYRPISVAGTQKLANTSSTALNFLNSGNVTFTYDSGLKASVDLSGYVPTSRTVNGHALSSNVTVTRGDVDANKVFYGTTTPTGMITNDIWIDTNNTV